MDVGGGIGYFTILFAKKAKKVVAIEPEPKNIILLRKNIIENKLKNVIIVEKAVWNTNGKLKLCLSKNDSFGHYIVRDELKHLNDRLVEVQANTLDNIIAKLKIREIDFMKMNVEGSEIEALKGAKECLSLTKEIIIQTHRIHHEGKMTTKEVKKLLKKAGVHCKCIKKKWQIFQ